MININNMKVSSFCLLVLVAVFAGCKKDVPVAHTVPEQLYITYKDGMINECWYQGNLYYTAGLNATDAPTIIYNSSGKQVAECNYFANDVDSLCKKVDSCRTIYICEDNIWHWQPVDLYGLSK
jgi:hypothetical protein